MLGQPTLHDRANKVNAALEAQLASLVSLEVGRILGMCGLADVVERVRWYASEGHAGDGVLSSDAALALPVVSGGLNALFDKVGDMGTLCDFTKIQVCWWVVVGLVWCGVVWRGVGVYGGVWRWE